MLRASESTGQPHATFILMSNFSRMGVSFGCLLLSALLSNPSLRGLFRAGCSFLFSRHNGLCASGLVPAVGPSDILLNLHSVGEGSPCKAVVGSQWL